MQFTITQAPLGARPPVVKPDPKVLQFLGEDNMRNLISSHYDLLRQSNIKGLFPPTDEGFEMAKKHSADFFIQIWYPSYKNSKIGLRHNFVNFYMKHSYSNKEQVLIAVDLNLSDSL